MRNLFLALLLANLGFAAWHAWFSRTRAAESRVEDEGVGITLVKELDARESGSEGAASAASAATEPPKGPAAPSKSDSRLAAAATPAPPQARCISVGPFRELAQAAAASAKLRSAGYAPSQRAGEGDVLVGYWVYLDGVMPGKEADGVLAKLHTNGVRDSYLIPSDNGDRVSLGVFTEIDRADRLRDQVRALGFEPVVADRTRREDVYWIDLSLPSGKPLDLAPLQTPGQINRLEQLPCPAAGGA